MASPNLSELTTTTLRERSGMLADNFTDNTALLFRLKEKGNKRPFSGGRTIVEELAYQENSTFTRYGGYDTVDVSASDVMTAAEYEIKQAAVAVTMSGLEELQNAGDSQVIDLLGQRVDNAEKTLINNLSADLYSDGTADGGKQMGGMQLIVADAGTGTVGGINSSTWTFWQNAFYDFSGEGVTPSASTITTAMNTLYFSLCRNRDKPDMVVGDNLYYQYYLESLQPQARFTNAKLADAGFVNVQYMGADVILDGGQGGDAPASHMYMLNTDYLHYRPHSRRDMVPLDPDRYATNQDAMVKLIGWAGNLTCSNRSLQGAIVA